MHIHRNPEAKEEMLKLNGEDLKLLQITLNGGECRYTLQERTLTIDTALQEFTLEIVTEINPLENSALDGLYKSDTIFCTQNEPEGFRRITYFLDRPDVMSKYTTKVIADRALYPVLLSNGNLIEKGSLSETRHWATWEDPFAKPCYLFALVAGDFGLIEDTFTTLSNRTIDLKIYCDRGEEHRCHHALLSLKKAMRWDEERFGLEYDLDIFMIVAVKSFNMGAMENKGLNIFNISCLLADEQSATDENYARVESVVAHEYFHNWTGNRVTCRDWFQLTLKEGLTVFRDQEFSADMNSVAVERIDQVLNLRSRQFEEDAGPTAHPIQPKSYIEINNFYTSTIYDKGAEVIRMLHTLLGKDLFRKGIETYFALYDGKAVTTEEFIRAMEIASDYDLIQFRSWYHQVGTPRITITKEDSELHFTVTPPSPSLSIPLKIAGISSQGEELFEEVVVVDRPNFSHSFPPAAALSINRNFSAPVHIEMDYSQEERKLLMVRDSDLFNRWEIGQKFSLDLMLGMVKQFDDRALLSLDESLLQMYGAILDSSTDQAFKARAMAVPSEEMLAQHQEIIDFDANYLVREYLLEKLALHLSDRLWSIYRALKKEEPYRYTPERVGERALKNRALSLLMQTKQEEALRACIDQYYSANNMTDRFAALQLLADSDCKEREGVFDHFYSTWKNDPFVMPKWFSSQALRGDLETVQRLERDPIFSKRVPNFVRALYGTFTRNHLQFNANSGESYAFIADKIVELDTINPQMAASLAKSFHRYAKLDSLRKQMMQRELERLLSRALSQNVYEVLSLIVK